MRNLFVLSIFSLLSCSVFESDDKKNNNGSNGSVSQLSSLTGQLMIETEEGELPAANAQISVVGHPEYSAVANSNGEVAIQNMLPGALEIYAVANTDGSSVGGLTLTSAETRAAQFKNIVIASSGVTQLPSDIKLTKPGAIKGAIAILNNPDNVKVGGTEVFIPGTSFIAKADDEGKFTLLNLAAGIYDQVRFNQEGLTESNLFDIEVTSGEMTDVGTVYLALSTGPSGRIVNLTGTEKRTIGSNEMVILPSKNVTLNLRYDSRATLMKLSHESSFINSDWQPVASSVKVDSKKNIEAFNYFQTDGSKSVFVKFSDQNGLESSVYKLDFIIDTEAPKSDGMELLYGWGQVSETAPGIHMTLLASDSGSGVKEVMACADPTFSGCQWSSYQREFYGSGLIAGPGLNTVYVKYRDYLDRESEIVSDSISGGPVTIVPTGTIAENITLYSEETPYQFSGYTKFTSDFKAEEGIEIVYDGGAGTVVFEGQVLMLGTQASPIVVTSEGGFGGFNASNSQSKNNLFEYINFAAGQSLSTTQEGIIQIDGGKILNCTLSLANSMWIYKRGVRPLVVSGNTLHGGAILILGGNGATIIEHNQFVTSTSGASGYTGIVQNDGSSSATGTIVRYNTFNMDWGGGLGGSQPAVQIYNGDLEFSNNQAIPTASSGAPTIVAIEGSGTINLTAEHNNLHPTCTMGSPDTIRHFYVLNGSGINVTVNPDQNFYDGHSTTNPQNQDDTGGATINTDLNTQITAWPTTGAKANGCVGHLCI